MGGNTSSDNGAAGFDIADERFGEGVEAETAPAPAKKSKLAGASSRKKKRTWKLSSRNIKIGLLWFAIWLVMTIPMFLFLFHNETLSVPVRAASSGGFAAFIAFFAFATLKDSGFDD